MKLRLFIALFLQTSLPVAYAASVQLSMNGGTFTVPVLINNRITLDFTLDSGAAETTIPADVFLTLQRTGTISEADLLQPGQYVLADGSTLREVRFQIRSLRIGDLELRDVAAAVAPVRGSLLLGQSFLTRIRTWSIDNERHVLLLNENVTAPAAASHPRQDYPDNSSFKSEPDYACGAAQNICRDGKSSLCDSYRDDFRRSGKVCPGVSDTLTAASTTAAGDPPGDYACGAARNICRDDPSSWLCKSYQQDFLRARRVCFGVTDISH